MRKPPLIRRTLLPGVGLIAGLSLSSLHAGSVVSLADGHEVSGKLTLGSDTIHVDGPTPAEIKLSDVLAANFSDAPFHLQYFQSDGDTATQLPTGWTAKAIGPADPVGTATYAAGALTLTGDGSPLQDAHPDHYFFAGMPWEGDGQWTAHLKQLAPPNVPTQVVMALRKSLDEGGGGWGNDFPADPPTWLRVTRCGISLDTSCFTEGRGWQVLKQESADSSRVWLGFMLNSRQDKVTGTAIIDHITFTPSPAQSEMVPPGILLTSGSFLSGTNIFRTSNFFMTSTTGGIPYEDKEIPVTTAQIAAVIYHPVTRRELALASEHPGMIAKNGDFLASDIQLLQGGMVQMSSIDLGLVSYYLDVVRACIVHPVRPLLSDYEIRLHDGSILLAKSFELADGKLTIQEISGLAITVDPSDIAQFRAGQTQVQPLISLPWKVHENPEPKTATDSSPGPASSSKAASELPNPQVVTCTGPNQEQILVVPSVVPVEFPLRGKFRSLALQLAVAPGAPANAQATLRILADGREITRTPPCKSGDAPVGFNVNLTNPQTLTFVVDASVPGAKLLLIDPVAVRSPTSP